MTEDEAKTKWCPLATPTRSDDPCKCISSQCMAWRWEQKRVVEAYDDTRLVYRDELSTTDGYCGLAGKP